MTHPIVHPRLDIDWCEIPAGRFFMGSRDTGDNPPREVETGPYRIGRYPITNSQYALFVAANPRWRKGAPPDDLADSDYLSDWEGDDPPADKLDHPVAWVSWHAASAFCRWASVVLGFGIELPPESHWEKACRGPQGNLYPWGNEIDPSRANYSSHAAGVGRTVDGRVPVGRYSPQGDSVFGCADMAGNVWEWCSGWTDEYEEERPLRGGAWNFTAEFLKGSFRFGCEPTAAYNYIGFRVAAPLPGSCRGLGSRCRSAP